MAGHIQDRWFRTVAGPDGVPIRVQSERHGKGLRYRARYVAPDGRERNRSFPDRHKRQAESWLAQIEADMARGHYVDPSAGKISVERYAKDWLASQTSDVSTRDFMTSRFRSHVLPHFGSRPIASIQPTNIRQWVRTLEEKGLAPSYRRLLFANVSSMFSAAVDDAVIGRNPCQAGSVKAPRLEPRKVKPWSRDQVFAVRAGLPQRYRAMVEVAAGCGLRQGEVFGLSPDDIDTAAGILHVARQVKLFHGGGEQWRPIAAGQAHRRPCAALRERRRPRDIRAMAVDSPPQPLSPRQHHQRASTPYRNRWTSK